MTFANGKMPASTDLVELIPERAHGADDIVAVRCLLCMQILGKVHYLNQAIKLWTDHQAEESST